MLLLKGILIGFSIAAPVGPIGILCIRRTLNQGRVYGLLSGLGAAAADASYGTVAAFGLNFIMQYLIEQSVWIRLIGAVFLCYLGIQTFRAQPPERNEGGAFTSGYLKTFLSTFLLTITNPMTILSFLGIFAGSGLSAGSGYASGIVLVLGVFAGSMLWWLILCNVFGAIGKHLGPGLLVWINRVSGIVLLVFGIVMVTAIR